MLRSTQGTASKPGTASKLLVPALCLCGTTVTLQQATVVPLLPDMPRLLGISVEDASWILTSTLLASAVATPVLSRLADMFGKRRIMLVCLVMMSIGSALAALDLSFAAMIAGRSLQGFAAALVPVGISVLREEIPGTKLAPAVAMISATLGFGSALGLPLAGVLYELLGWQSIFWSAAAAGIVLIAVLPLVMSKSRIRTPGRFDYGGAILLSVALTAALLALTKGGTWGWTSAPTLMTAATAVITLALWFPLELKISQPILDLRTSARKPVLITNLVAVLVGYSMYSNLLSTIQQLQMPYATGYGFGLSVMAAGLCMVPTGLAMVIFTPISALSSRRWGAKTALIIGSLVSTAGFISRLFLTEELWMVMLGAAVIGIGNAIAYAAMPTLIMGSVPVTVTAAANGLNTVLRVIGTTVGSAAVAVLLASTTLTLDGTKYPSFQALEHIFWIAVSAALTAAVLASFLPVSRPERRGRRRAGGHDERREDGTEVGGHKDVSRIRTRIVADHVRHDDAGWDAPEPEDRVRGVPHQL
ncbi:MFS transporter [Arthrobacter sp. ZGTC131]|uniref:MFS transporter n=1 Tax=Arthrobacter sp. ZGTC131 TaxID=2058898 RepID=UPI0015E467F8|nr:MFS transporter [Arthrobacter sp. ZGTC131]